MKKVKLQLPTAEWDNLVTKYAPDDSRFVSQNAFTDGSKNIETDSDGTIRKMKGGVEFATIPTATKDMHEAIFSDGSRHMLVVENGNLRYTSGAAAFTLVTSGYSTAGNFEFATTQNRVYFGNGINATQVYDRSTSYGGVSYSAPQTKVAGAQAPSSAPTANTPTAGGSVPDGAHTYKITYLYYDSEESNGSTASGVQTCGAGNNTIPLTSIPIGGYGVTARKIYRDNNDGNYILIDTITDNTTTTYNDTSIGGTTPIPVDNGIPPVAGQIELYLDRLWFAQISGEPYTLYFSEVGLPDIVESTNFIDCNQEDPITSLFVYRGRLVVFNRRSMGQILGDSRDNFRYDPIQGSVGCVDNRSIQEAVVNGVPTLIWMSDKGIYGFNGSSVTYLSDSIENILNNNIRQSVIQRNEHVDTSNTDFDAGTVPDSIDTTGGQLQAIGYVDGTSTVGTNPRREWNDTADWEGGTLSNVRTIGLSNTMEAVTDYVPDLSTNGSIEVVERSGTSIILPVQSDFTGEASTIASTYTQTSAGGFLIRGYYQRIVPEKTGTITQVRVSGRNTQPSTTYEIGIMEESAGLPNRSAKVATVEVAAGPIGTPAAFITAAIAANVTKDTAYWIYQEVRAVDNLFTFNMPWVAQGSYLSGNDAVMYDEVGFRPVVNIFSGQEFPPAMDYVMVQDPVAGSGQWISDVYDTQSESADIELCQANFGIDFSYHSAEIVVEAGDELDLTNELIIDNSVSHTVVSSNPSFAVALDNYRYFRIRVVFQTNDDRQGPLTLGGINLHFASAGVWTSEAINTTADATVYNTLSSTSVTPSGTNVQVRIRTATTEAGLTAEPWVTFGSHTVRKWAQIQITLNKDTSYLVTPTVSLLTFIWTIVSEFISQAIDTTVDPSGWDIFQTDFDTNGGTVVFEMRSAATSGGLTGATWYTVTNGNFPTASLPSDQWVQYRVTMTTTDGNVPVVRSVTLRWFIGTDTNIRAASIFHDKGYYLALAEFGSDENNIILKLDENGKWRLKRGLGVSTLGFFFNEPYFGQSTAGVVGKFLTSLQDLGTNIEVDIRTKAFDFSNSLFDNSEFTKVLESVTLEGRGTGCTYDVSYSLDGGETFTDLVDIQTGLTTLTTTNDNQLFARVFRVDHSDGQVVGAKTIMFRIHTNDEFELKLHRIKATAFITLQEPIITG